jgi:hypothetical protein
MKRVFVASCLAAFVLAVASAGYGGGGGAQNIDPKDLKLLPVGTQVARVPE